MNCKTLIVMAILLAIPGTLPAEDLPPIACNLKALTSQQRKHLGELGEHVIAAITESRELNDGYAFRVDPSRATVVDVAQWLELWRLCCPFYEFQIELRAADASLWLSLKGRPGVKEYIPIDSPRLAAKIRK
jgi:hypothetical protein